MPGRTKNKIGDDEKNSENRLNNHAIKVTLDAKKNYLWRAVNSGEETRHQVFTRVP